MPPHIKKLNIYYTNRNDEGRWADEWEDWEDLNSPLPRSRYNEVDQILDMRLDGTWLNPVSNVMNHLQHLSHIKIMGTPDKDWKYTKVDVSLFKNRPLLKSLHLNIVAVTDKSIEFSDNLEYLSLTYSKLDHVSLSDVISALPDTVTELTLKGIASSTQSDSLDVLNKLSRLRRLTLTDMSVTLPSKLDGLRDLKYLNISGCKGIMDCNMSLLSSLSTLIMVKSDLTDIPDSVLKLTQLTDIQVYRNKISDISTLIRLLNSIPCLETVNVNQNGISGDISRITEVDNLSHLRYLDLASNNLHGEVFDDLLVRMPNILEISLYNNAEVTGLVNRQYHRVTNFNGTKIIMYT